MAELQKSYWKNYSSLPLPFDHPINLGSLDIFWSPISQTHATGSVPTAAAQGSQILWAPSINLGTQSKERWKYTDKKGILFLAASKLRDWGRRVQKKVITKFYRKFQEEETKEDHHLFLTASCLQEKEAMSKKKIIIYFDTKLRLHGVPTKNLKQAAQIT